MKRAIIAALARNRVIGRDNALPWRLPADLRRFKTLTMGHTLVMGRKTFESIGKPLPGRAMVVISRGGFQAPPGVQVVSTVEEALASAASGELFIAGGAEIYAQTIGLADRMYLTLLDADVEGDAYFPEFDPAEWQITQREKHERGEGPFAFEFLVYEKSK